MHTCKHYNCTPAVNDIYTTKGCANSDSALIGDRFVLTSLNDNNTNTNNNNTNNNNKGPNIANIDLCRVFMKHVDQSAVDTPTKGVGIKDSLVSPVNIELLNISPEQHHLISNI